MDQYIEYSPRHLGRIAAEGRVLLEAIEESARTVAATAEGICREQADGEAEKALELLREYLDEMISGYRAQIDHMEMASQLYEQCAAEVCAEAEKCAAAGGKAH